MIDVYFWPTPTCMKVTIMLEECGLPYRILPIDIGTGVQYGAGYRAINPNSRVPAIVDHAPADDGAAVTVFESGAILQYLADKTGLFWPQNPRARIAVSQWLFWQVGGLGPMAGQAGHFRRYAPEPLPYPTERYTRETTRLYGVMDHVLAQRPYLAAADYTIADVVAWPWILPELHGQDLAQFPNLERWHGAVAVRAAVQRAKSHAQEMRGGWSPVVDEATRRNLFAFPLDRIGQS